ncbi:hypothetical protein [Oleiagrimonas soli]|uniref:Uncharacterized protein n=1 Tax=Oleiagrimonas soli TaxID=1543381 RepID=A0A099CZY6_9GAMM|nr:hypothetical protein [Oleiagrimonas soli]KGI79157.1 hypothetical protein LF63_0100460 [Oleiagrimonas soli]MBB6184809.1 hypothetical protein [Oleiagrimonas soli]
MNTILITPWRGTPPQMRWIGSGVLVLCALGAALAGALAHKSDWPMTSAMILGFGLAYGWAFLMASTMLLAVDAHQLRLPGIARRITLSILVYLLLSVVPATLVLGAFGGHYLSIALVLLLFCLVGLAFTTLPRFIAMWMVFLPALSGAMKHTISIPGPSSPLFFDWAGPAVLLLSVVIVLRWRQLVRAEKRLEQGLSSAMVMQFRRKSGWNEWSMACQDGSSALRNRPDWMLARVDLRRVGPKHLARTLRVALGGWYVPRSFVGHLRNLAPALLPMVVILPVLLIVQTSGKPSAALLRGFSVGMIGWIGIFGSAMVAIMSATTLRRRWSQVNGELPLLALLPGLGDVEQVKRTLLRAALRPPAVALAIIMVLMLLAAWALHMNALGMVAIALSQIGCGLLLFALALDVLGGRPMASWKLAVLITLTVTLTSLSCFMPITSLGRDAWAYADRVVAMLIAAWIGMAGLLLVLGWRGARRFRHRRHAFLMLDTAAPRDTSAP